MSVIEAITHGIPETFRCVLDKLIIVVSGIGSIAFVIFLIAQKKQPFLFSFVEFREGCFLFKIFCQALH